MKSVLISIQPKWCELIARGKKTIEVRKTRPKIDVPFRVYIYCTKPNGKYDYGLCIDKGVCGSLKSVGLLAKCNYEFAERNQMPILSGKVIGEFACDAIIRHCEMANADIAEQQGCIKREKLLEYANGKELYGWHISDLVIYDKPKELSEFYVNEKTNCPAYLNGICLNRKQNDVIRCENFDCQYKKLTRPPQSWCYIEHMDEKGR